MRPSVKSVILGVVTTLLLAGCAGRIEEADGDHSESQPTAIPTRTASADLATGAATLREMRSQQNLAIVTAIAGASRETTATEPADSLPVTHQEFTVTSQMRGKVASEFTVSFTGGVVTDKSGEFILQLEGQPQFNEGDEYFLILTDPLPNGEYWVFGGAQGRYRVVEGALALDGGAPTDEIMSTLIGLRPAQALQALSG